MTNNELNKTLKAFGKYVVDQSKASLKKMVKVVESYIIQ